MERERERGEERGREGEREPEKDRQTETETETVCFIIVSALLNDNHYCVTREKNPKDLKKCRKTI